jgi:hypothetical protein
MTMTTTTLLAHCGSGDFLRSSSLFMLSIAFFHVRACSTCSSRGSGGDGGRAPWTDSALTALGALVLAFVCPLSLTADGSAPPSTLSQARLGTGCASGELDCPGVGHVVLAAVALAVDAVIAAAADDRFASASAASFSAIEARSCSSSSFSAASRAREVCTSRSAVASRCRSVAA